MKYYVYVVTSTKKYFKIGVAKNPDRRLSELQTGNPEPLQIEILIQCPSEKAAYGLESLLHRRFSRRRVRNEWFFFGKKDEHIKAGRETVYNKILNVVSDPNYEMSFRITKWPKHKIKEAPTEDRIPFDEESIVILYEQEKLHLNHMRDIFHA